MDMPFQRPGVPWKSQDISRANAIVVTDALSERATQVHFMGTHGGHLYGTDLREHRADGGFDYRFRSGLLVPAFAT
jgi:hypothetical protein